MKKKSIPSILLVFVMLAFIQCKEEPKKKKEEVYEPVSYFTMNNGELERPKGYRSWVYVGTPVTPNDLNNGKAPFPEMHNVYIDPASYDHYKKTGTWREGTILVKELVSIGSKAAVSGNGYFAGDFIGLEASVKSKADFPNEPGNWAIFSFTNGETGVLKNAAPPMPTNACNSCHEANADDDFVFTQYYPVLRAAKGVGLNISPENNPDRHGMDKMAAMAEEMADTQWTPKAETPDVKLDVPLDKKGLYAYLKSGKYKEFKTKETGLHPSLGPHQKLGLPVRVFINDVLANSLKAGNKEHPMGSVSIKEMYDDKKKMTGWAVMAKTQNDSDAGNGWFWYELTDPSSADNTLTLGNGVVGCISCHNIGKDMVRSHYPLQ